MFTNFKDPLVGVLHAKRRYARGAWTEERNKIILGHLDKGRTMKEIQAIMRSEHGFDATISMYKKQFKILGARVHFNKKERVYIFRQCTKLGRVPTFKYIDTGKKVNKDRVRRLFESRTRYYQVIPRDESVSPAGLRIDITAAPTPADVVNKTGTLMEDTMCAHNLESSVNQELDPDLLEGEHMTVVASLVKISNELEAAIEAIAVDHSAPVSDAEAYFGLFRDLGQDKTDYRGISSERCDSNNAETVVHDIEGIVRDVTIDLAAFNKSDFPEFFMAQTQLTDRDVDLFLADTLKVLNIPLDYHVHTQKTFSGSSTPIPSFEEWEQMHYRDEVGQDILPSANTLKPCSPKLLYRNEAAVTRCYNAPPPSAPLLELALASDMHQDGDLCDAKDTKNETTLNTEDHINGLELCYAYEMQQMRMDEEDDETANDKDDRTGDDKGDNFNTTCRKLQQIQVISNKECARIKRDRAHTRTWNDLTVREKTELSKAEVEIDEYIFQTLGSRVPVNGANKERARDVYRRILGSAAEESLDVERSLLYTEYVLRTVRLLAGDLPVGY